MGFSGRLETAANAATIVVAGLLSAVLVKVYLQPKREIPRPTPVPEITVGGNLKNKIDGVNWVKNRRTLVLAISTQCHFCSDSAPFFRQLVALAGNNVKILAVLPQPVPEGQQYLRREGVRVDQVKQLVLSRIGVQGTPTMLLVDGTGAVTNVWVGELQAGQQEQVLAVLKRAPAESELLPLVRTLKARP